MRHKWPIPQVSGHFDVRFDMLSCVVPSQFGGFDRYVFKTHLRAHAKSWRRYGITQARIHLRGSLKRRC